MIDAPETTLTPTANDAEAFVREVTRLTRYLDAGLLSDREYEAAIARLLSGPAEVILSQQEERFIPLD